MSFDFGTSFGQYELNPVLGQGKFGATQIAIGSGITVGALLLQHHLEVKHPDFKDGFNYSNLSISAMHAGLGASNLIRR